MQHQAEELARYILKDELYDLKERGDVFKKAFEQVKSERDTWKSECRRYIARVKELEAEHDAIVAEIRGRYGDDAVNLLHSAAINKIEKHNAND